jgi:carboxyl-terminal processing protease
MSQKSKIFLSVVGISIIFVLVVGFVAAGAYHLGQKSASSDFSVARNNATIEKSDTRQTAKSIESSETVSDLPDQVENPDSDESNSSLPIDEVERSEESEAGTESASLRSTNISQEDLEILLEVWEIVGKEFDGGIPSNDELTYGAIAGSLELLDDQFTRFVPPELAALMREQLQGSFEGIGAFVDMTEEGYLLIVQTIRGQPAELAGIRDGDIVTHVNGNSVLGKSVDAIVAEVKGPRGTEVKLTIVRESESEPLEFAVTRDVIELPMVEAVSLEDGIAYVRLSSFTGSAASQLKETLEEQLENEPKGLILDLRDNPGGFLNQSVEVADLFLPEGTVLFQRDNKGGEQIFESDDGDIAEEIPLVVLINRGSASASEIVAGAIQDRERGILIGESTFGKGSVQKTFTLSDGSELKVTISRWYTPDNISISEIGISPNIQVDTIELSDGTEDVQLQRAIEYLSAGS